MYGKFPAIRRVSAALLAAGLLLAGPPGGAQAAAVYTAGDDDTFWKLSQRYGVPLDTLMAANPNIDPLNIYRGLKLIIPDAGGRPASIGKAAQGTVAAPGTAAAKSAQANVRASGDAAVKSAQSNVNVSGRNAAQAAAATAGFVAGQAAAAPKTYKKAFQVKATAYTASAEENGKWGAVDYFGNPLRVGTVAVDPKVIPFGTKLYITGYDYAGLPKGGMYAIASDTGGAIRGNRIDIFVPDSRSQAMRFGIQYVTVYIL